LAAPLESDSVSMAPGLLPARRVPSIRPHGFRINVGEAASSATNTSVKPLSSAATIVWVSAIGLNANLPVESVVTTAVEPYDLDEFVKPSGPTMVTEERTATVDGGDHGFSFLPCFFFMSFNSSSSCASCSRFGGLASNMEVTKARLSPPKTRFSRRLSRF